MRGSLHRPSCSASFAADSSCSTRQATGPGSTLPSTQSCGHGVRADGAVLRRILNHTIDVLYRNEEVLTFLGYQGSSIEYGGYLNRGFDDIDWLPES